MEVESPEKAVAHGGLVSVPETGGTSEGGKQRRLRLNEARRELRAQLRRCVDVETVPLSAALHRLLAGDLVAAIDLPGQDRAAVDGFAIRAADLRPGEMTRLEIIGRSAAGHPWEGVSGARSVTTARGAVRIFTGAMVPRGFDTVVMQEACPHDGRIVTIPAGIAIGANIRRCGEDYAAGALALTQGHRLRPCDLSLAAALGTARLPVYRRLRVALFSTGDELLDSRGGLDGAALKQGQALSLGQAWDANRPLLMGQLAELGCEVSDFGVLPDRVTKTIGALADAAHDHDLIVTSGGMSVGDEDYVKRVIRRRGSLEIWQLAIKPGKPVGFGDIDDCPILALPGNPVAAMVTFMMLGSLVVARLSGSGEDLPQGMTVTAGARLNKPAGRRDFLPAILRSDETGRLTATPFAKKGSAMISALVGSEGLIDLAEETVQVEPGDPLRFVPFRQPGF